MAIKLSYPPNYELIVAAIPEVKDAQPVFCYGLDIYNPYRHQLDEHIVAHESVHFVQQLKVGGPDLWWQRYLEDPKFRFEQELEAYQRQLKSFKQSWTHTGVRRIHLPYKFVKAYGRMLANSLSSPMYGSVVNVARARHLLGVA